MTFTCDPRDPQREPGEIEEEGRWEDPLGSSESLRSLIEDFEAEEEIEDGDQSE